MKKIYSILCGVVILISAYGCEDNTSNSDFDASNVPTADFDFITTEGSGEVTFVNKSTGANVYAWEFGDVENSFSIDKSPGFKYPTAGTYTVTATLYAGNGTTGVNDKISKQIALVDVPPSIIIDGDVSDWEGVPFVGVFGSGNLERIKVDGSGNNINIYIEGNDALDVSSPEIFLDIDGDITTGANFGWYANPDMGIDMFGDGSRYWYALFSGEDQSNQWSWSWAQDENSWITVADVVEIAPGKKAVEFAFSKAKLNFLNGGRLSNTGISFGFGDKKGGRIPTWGDDQPAIYIPF